MLRAALLSAVVLLAAPTAAQAATARIYFTKGEQLAYVERDLPIGVEPALKALMAGPPAGYGTTLPAGVTAKVKGTSIDFTPNLKDYAARAQVVYTTASGEDEVKIDGKTYTREDFGPEPYVEPEPPARKVPAPAKPKDVQTKLAALGYLPTSAITGAFDYRTMQAVLAFQAWTGLDRDGVVGPMTLAKLQSAGRPLPLDRTSKGRRVEIYRAQGVVLLINSGKVVRAIHTSTGIGGDSPDIGTPPGKWKIYRKEVKSWSVPYKTWLPYAAYWVGGWALHGYADVPARPASHGCARLPLPEAKYVYDFVSIGTPVQVI
ncbi:L,D-transpeptidase family protein [Solirubrobacter phytolaccae]|uniref:L,D-transpeptidase family protein n=1 Tax=Solirubrobacter phytolaccae TaxID=1404360 RepID=A0A9X3SE51_9ACTN|nr:peptidoglycan-binding protein [Solirubrobacter phytolaccae]MDA0180047.1 L,D-transpeptidase family protein [Solirubrobacter phytolaccae]